MTPMINPRHDDSQMALATSGWFTARGTLHQRLEARSS